MKSLRVVVARPFLDQVRHQLADEPGSVVQAEAGLRRDGHRLELFVPSSLPGPVQVEARSRRPGARAEAPLFGQPTLHLGLAPCGAGHAELHVAAGIVEVDEVLVSGSGMERWVRDGRGSAAQLELRNMRATVVGCSRLGSALAVGLARAGIGELTLIDADVLEEHSLDAVECYADAVGRRKVEAVAAYLASIAPALQVRALAEPVESPTAFDACASADLVVSAPDDNRARLVAAFAATTHHRLHLDVGAGVFTEGGVWTAGADVRLRVPLGDCLLCAGGLDLSRRPGGDWRRERAGSLRSLNHIAAGQAIALVERLVTGGLISSVWVRVMLEQDGGVSVEEMSWVPDRWCRLCTRWAGSGNRALGS